MEKKEIDLTEARIRILRHVAECEENDRRHNVRWKEDAAVAGAWAGSAIMPRNQALALERAGFLREVVHVAGHRGRGKYALTDFGRTVLRNRDEADKARAREVR